MVSSTLCPAVHILGSQNVYGRAEGIADHYWPWAIFFFLLFLIPLRGFKALTMAPRLSQLSHSPSLFALRPFKLTLSPT